MLASSDFETRIIASSPATQPKTSLSFKESIPAATAWAKPGVVLITTLFNAYVISIIDENNAWLYLEVLSNSDLGATYL